MFIRFRDVLAIVFFAGKWYNIGKKIGRLQPPYLDSNKFVKPDGSILMTDESNLYNRVKMEHESVNHQEFFVDGIIHTNTIEGFWSLLKRAWFGSHHHYQRKYTPLYLAEASFKYNHRKNRQIFATFLIRGFS